VANHWGASKINYVVQIIDYLMFDYVVDYVIIEFEALNTSICVYLKLILWIIAHMVNLGKKNITISNVQTLLSFL
jgi:hypothetical protein